MALQPFTRRVSPAYSSMVPFGGADWDMDVMDPLADPFAITARDPFALGAVDPLGIQRQLYNDPLVRHTMRNAQLATRGMEPILNADLFDFGDRYEVSSDLPGVRKEDLDISFNEGCITIKGERKKEWSDSDIWGNRRSERTYGKVSRTMTLPLDCDTDKANADFSGGVLKVTLPKKSIAVTGKKLLIK